MGGWILMTNTSHPRIFFHIVPPSCWFVLQNLILPLIIKSVSITYIKHQNKGASIKISTASKCHAPTYLNLALCFLQSSLKIDAGKCSKYKGLWLRVTVPFLFVPLLFLLTIWLLMIWSFVHLPRYHIILPNGPFDPIILTYGLFWESSPGDHAFPLYLNTLSITSTSY